MKEETYLRNRLLRLLASHQGVSGKSMKIYKSTGSVPIIGLKLGRLRKEVPEEWKEIIKQEYEKYRQNALYQEDMIFARCKIRITHNTIHKVMLEFEFAREQEESLGYELSVNIHYRQFISIGIKARSMESNCAVSWMMHREKCWLLENLIMRQRRTL